MFLEPAVADAPAHQRPIDRKQNRAPVALAAVACVAAVLFVVLNIFALAGHVGAAPVVIALLVLGVSLAGAVGAAFARHS